MTGKYRSILIITAAVTAASYLILKLGGQEIPRFLNLSWVYLILLYTVLHALENGTDRTNTSIALGAIIILFFTGGIPFGSSLLSGLTVLALGISFLLWKKQEGMSADQVPTFSAIFSSRNISLEGEIEDGTSLFALFGEISYEGSDVNVRDDLIIDAASIFASTHIYLPRNCRVEVLETPLLGSVKNRREEYEEHTEDPLITVRALALFSEVVIH